jgi:hypothetical protein
MDTDKEKFKLLLALYGLTLVEETSCRSKDEYYCGIMKYSADKYGEIRDLAGGDLYAFSPDKQKAFEKVYKKWISKKKSSHFN